MGEVAIFCTVYTEIKAVFFSERNSEQLYLTETVIYWDVNTANP